MDCQTPYKFILRSMIAIVAFSISGYANPVLTPGVWTDITPSWLKGTSFQTCLMTFDPSNRSTLYLTGSFGYKLGLLKSTDGGSTWSRIGNPPASPNYDDTVTYLDAPYQVAVDPANPSHLVATEMTPGGGVTLGFWVTYDGGAKWVRTKGFIDAVKAANGGAVNACSMDAGHFAIDPTDFNHILVAFHCSWTTGNNTSGIFETKDCGNTFIVHNPAAGMAKGSKGVFFIFEPSLGIGDKNTWLVIEDGNGIFRTSDAGLSWTEVSSTLYTCHGGTSSHVFTKSGMLYTGGGGFLLRSPDKGVTWQQTPNTEYHMYYAVASDGNKLYIGGAGTVGSGASAWYTSPETDDSTWTKYTGVSPSDGVTDLQYDSVNHIMYSAMNSAGLWALKTQGASSIASNAIEHSNPINSKNADLIVTLTYHNLNTDNRNRSISKAAFYNIKGMLMGYAPVGNDGVININKGETAGQVLIVKVK